MFIPIYFSKAKNVAKIKKLTKIPNVVYAKFFLTLFGRVAPNFVREKILIAKTGKTQGIKLRIKPPKTANKIIFKLIFSDSGTGGSLVEAPCSK